MKTFKNGEKAKYGLYVATNTLDVRFVGADGETIEGKNGARYLQLPIVLALLASPIIGGVFVMAFPVLVVMIAAYAVVQFIVNKIGAAVGKHAHLAVMRWEPTAAYLNKTEKKEKKDAKDSEKKEKH